MSALWIMSLPAPRIAAEDLVLVCSSWCRDKVAPQSAPARHMSSWFRLMPASLGIWIQGPSDGQICTWLNHVFSQMPWRCIWMQSWLSGVTLGYVGNPANCVSITAPSAPVSQLVVSQAQQRCEDWLPHRDSFPGSCSFQQPVYCFSESENRHRSLTHIARAEPSGQLEGATSFLGSRSILNLTFEFCKSLYSCFWEKYLSLPLSVHGREEEKVGEEYKALIIL
jgi:hypothetical protein